MTGIVAAVPLQIAMLAGLGPRPVAEDGAIVIGDIDDPLAADELPAAVAAVVAAPDVMRWSARASWNGHDGPAEREVVVIDGGSAGLLLCTPVPGEEGTAFQTCSSTDVWRLLCALLPYPSELG